MTTRRARTFAATGALLLLLGTAACSNDDKGDDAAKTTTTAEKTTTTAASKELDVLVSNDDGYDADGIDALVEALRKVPNTKVTVYAPLTQQSGQGGNTTDGKLKVEDLETKSGYPVKAVDGHPADAVRVALDDDGLKPDVVITGINEGQNLGPVIDVSGTVGAARAATQRGIPSLATSQGSTTFDYQSAVPFILDWVKEHRADLVAGKAKVEVDNMNFPSCQTGKIRGLAEVPAATSGTDQNTIDQDCASTATGQKDDVTAFVDGFATLSVIPTEPASGT